MIEINPEQMITNHHWLKAVPVIANQGSPHIKTPDMLLLKALFLFQRFFNYDITLRTGNRLKNTADVLFHDGRYSTSIYIRLP
ncbi:MAG: hypothetical protein MI892_31505 [Desulfobacterales bacterium]|nr:hypothetical protein [Desulfobacterales bacterium]